MVVARRARCTRSCAADVQVEYDDSGAIGRRYRRQDEIGTPYAFTIDEQTLEDETVTVRDRDSLAQERLPLSRSAARGWPTRSDSPGRRRSRDRPLELSRRPGASTSTCS